MNGSRRIDDLVVEHTDDEVLVYDLRTNEAHHLDPLASDVWLACDEAESIDDLATRAGTTPTIAAATVERLAALDLVDRPAGLTRRQTLERTVLVGTAAVALPVIKSIVAPSAARAATMGGPGSICTTGAECASGQCNNPTAAVNGGTCI